MRKFFEFQNSAKIVCGDAALLTIGTELSRLGAKAPFLLTSANAEKLGVKDKVKAALKNGGVGKIAEGQVVPNKVDLDFVRAQKAVYANEECDAIVAVGGDVTMDTAKCLKLILSQEWEEILPIVAESVVKKTDVPFVAIPSENGSGKEANGFLEVGEYYLSSSVLVPNVVIIDSDVAMAAPIREVAACGTYALANAIEAYIESEKNEMAEIYAEKAISLLSENLINAVNDSENENACRGVALAATLAGVAYGAVPYGAAHALAEGLHAASGEPLEEMFALTLVPAISRARERYDDRIKKLYFLLVGATEYAETPESERADRAIVTIKAMLEELNKTSNLPIKISQTKITRESFGNVADAAIEKRASITAFGPIGREDFVKMLNEAY